MALKIKVKRIAGVPTTSNLETGEIGLNTSNNQLYVNISGTITAVSGGAADLSAVAEDIIPDANETRDLGTSSYKWKELHLAGSTIFLGDAKIKATGTNITDEDGNKLGVANDEGTPARVVPFYTAAGGLSTANKNFVMKGTSDRKLTFLLTLASGSAQTAVIGTTLFEF
jgi:hypothetical protein